MDSRRENNKERGGEWGVGVGQEEEEEGGDFKF